MTSSRGKCRAIFDSDGTQTRGCQGKVDALVLVRVPHDKQPRNETFVKIGLCKRHTRQWIDSLESGGPPVQYKPHQPPVIEDLTGPDEIPDPETLLAGTTGAIVEPTLLATTHDSVIPRPIRPSPMRSETRG